MPLPHCHRCGNCHIGCLIFAPSGIRTLIVAEVEAAMSYEDSVVYEYAWSPTVNWPKPTGKVISISGGRTLYL
jgi:hypothetical protein